MPRVVVLRVLSEDPWRAEPIKSIECGSIEEALEKLEKLLREAMERGYECFDYGAETIQVCAKIVQTPSGFRVDRIAIGVQIDAAEILDMDLSLGIPRGSRNEELQVGHPQRGHDPRDADHSAGSHGGAVA